MKSRSKGELLDAYVSGRHGGIEDLPRVLLFLSREDLTLDQRKYLAKVFGSDIDVDFLLQQCDQRLIAPIALGHLIELGGERFADRLAAWKHARRSLVAQSMRLNSELADFHELCKSDNDSDHVFVKGPSLAVQFYLNPALRQCRDIDVLVQKNTIGDLVYSALDAGYAISSDAYGEVAHRGAEAVDAFVKMNDVITLRSPKGVYFELHKTLDRNTGLFDTSELFANARALQFFGRTIKVLPPELLLCYVVYHSTQHTWARLNWFTDLHAVLSHESFDHDLCLGRSRRVGLEDLVAACIELDNWCSCGARDPKALGAHAKLMHDLFVKNIEGGLEREKQIIIAEHSFGLPHRFLAARHARRRALKRHFIQAFTPDFDLYRVFPMARPFWWVYSSIHPIVALFGLLKNLVGKRRYTSR